MKDGKIYKNPETLIPSGFCLARNVEAQRPA